MKPIDIKALAEEAGFIFWSDGWRAGKIDWSCDYDEDLERFANLVEAAVREECARKLLDAPSENTRRGKA